MKDMRIELSCEGDVETVVLPGNLAEILGVDLVNDPATGWEAIGWAIMEAGGDWPRRADVFDIHEIPVTATVSARGVYTVNAVTARFL